MQKIRIAVIDYGMGNLFSVAKAFEFIGCAVTATDDPAALDAADAVVLPGVGAFPDAIARLRESGMDAALLKQIHRNKPILGICLGMQLLFDGSDEYGKHTGLGIYHDWFTKMDLPLKVPHMGWNALRDLGCPILRGVDGRYFYFVHSYWATDTQAAHAAGIAEYGRPFVAVAMRGNTFATQFHPEKSGEAGLCILQNFADLAKAVRDE